MLPQLFPCVEIVDNMKVKTFTLKKSQNNYNVYLAVQGIVIRCGIRCAQNFGNTLELQWLKHLWNSEKIFKTGVVRANEC